MTSQIEINSENKKILEKINNLLEKEEITKNKFNITINTIILCESIESVGSEYILQLALQKLISDNKSSEYDKNIAQKIYFLIGIESFIIDDLFKISPFIGLFALKTLIQYKNQIINTNSLYHLDEAIGSLQFQFNYFIKKIE